MEKNVGLSFDATITAKDAKKNLRVPMVNRTTKNDAKSEVGNEAALSSLVPIKDLVIDMTYQRAPQESKVMKIVNNFNPDAIGVLICSAREDGIIAVIDGGHRVAALRLMGMENENVDALVYFGLSLKEEAQIFTLMNDNRTKPKTSDIFKSKVISGDENSLIINSIIERHGLVIANGPGMNHLRALGTVNDIYKRYGADVLDVTIDCLIKAFSKHSSDLSDQALLALSLVIGTHKETINSDRVVTILKHFGNANNWAALGANVARNINAKKSHIGMSFLFANEYNKRLKNNKIDIAAII